VHCFRVKAVLCLFVLLLLCGCAKQGYPPGGPMDKIGPVIVSVYPLPEATGISGSVKPWIILDEYPNRNTVESSIFISPEPEEGFDVKIRGKRITVIFKQELPINRTVVVTFGAGISDQVGNQMAESYVLAFSTGDNVDNASISGYIEGMENPGAVWVWGYPLESFAEPDPRLNKAPYATQPDLEGSFTLSYLPKGSYRIFAVTETRRNRLWDSERESIALPPRDVPALEDQMVSINLKMHSVDLIPPSFRGAEAISRQTIRLSFDEPVAALKADISAMTERGQTLGIIDVYQNPADSNAVLLTTGIQREGDVYHFEIDNLCDLAGNEADSLIFEVDGSTEIDTVGPHFTWSSPSNGETGVVWGDAVLIGFSESITTTTIPAAVRITVRDSAVVEGKWSFPSSNLGKLEPSEPFENAEYHTVTVYCDSVKDIFGNTSPDSVGTFGFTTADVENTGVFSGQVANAPQELRIIATGIEAGGAWEEAVLEDGAFRFNDLPASLYSLTLYRDLDGNDRFSPGIIEPFTFAEPFKIWSDTLRVRSRWETGDFNLYWEASDDSSYFNRAKSE